MTIQELENKVCNDLSKIGVDLDELKEKDVISFSDTLGKRAPGIYVFVDDKKYRLIELGDRGTIEVNKSFSGLKSLLYEIYDVIIFNLSVRYELENRKNGQDFRRILFQKELELFRSISITYYIRKKKAINAVLKSSPYND